MRRSSLALGLLFALVGCSAPPPTQPPAMSPPVQVSDAIVASDGYVDRPLDDATHALDLAFAGGQYLVVWTQLGALGDDIYAGRVTPDGQVLDGAGFDVSSASGDEQAPAVASNGTDWLVVWQDHRAGPLMNIYAARVSASGTVLDPAGISVCTQTDHQVRPAVAFDGTNYLVVWADHRSGQWDVYGARVSSAGAVLDANGGFPIATATGHQQDPSVAFDGVNYLVAWQDQRNGDANIYGARVTPAGTVVDPGGIAISSAPNVQSGPVLVYDGVDYVVAWQDLRTGVADVYAARVQSSGTVLDANGVAVSAAASAQQVPAIAFDGQYVVSVWEDGRSGIGSDVYGARLDLTAAVLDPSGFVVASGTNGKAAAIASDRAGRGIVAYDALDPTNGAVHLRVRAITDWAVLDVQKTGKGGGAVASAPAGVDCGPTCSARFDAPTSVTLSPAPDGDSVFGGWSGACSGSGACTVTVDAAKSVTAKFLPLYAVNVSLAGGPGTVTSTPSGIDCGGTCSSRFAEGSSVQLTPKGSPGVSVFSQWSGDCAGAEACSLQIDAPKAVTATFVPAYSVSLSPYGSGSGTLALSGTTCGAGGNCAVDVAAGTTVSVTASPDSASVLKSWSGCTSSSANVCTVSVTSTKYVAARFEPSSFALNASTSGTGGGSLTGAGLACATGSAENCAVPVENPPYTTQYNTVTLTATPDLNSVFKSWSGCSPVVGTPNVCTVTVSSVKYVSAKFEPRTFSLMASTSGTGVGTVNGAGLSCTTGSVGVCTAAVDNLGNSTSYNTVTLTATPDGSSAFKSWSGCTPVAGAPNTCTVYVSGVKYVSARFEPSTWPVTAVVSGTGAGTIAGAGLSCTLSTPGGCTAAVENPANSTLYNTVTLTATPDASSSFKSWSGCIPVSGTPNSCTLFVNGSKSLTAKFEPSTYPLTVSASGTGVGTVGGAGLACATGGVEGCVAAIVNPTNTTAYTSVTLSATPDASSVFKSWSGCTPLADPSTCSISVNVPKFVSAKFEPSTFSLGASASGLGVGTITGGGLSCTTGSEVGCASAVPNPANSSAYTTVTLTARPDASSVFKSWSGCTAVTGAPDVCTLSVGSPKYVSAKFEPSTWPLSASTSGNGVGTINGAGLSCTTGSPDGCTSAVANPGNTTNYGTVTLTATPDASSVFKSWSGCTPVTGAPASCTVSVSGAKFVSARFEPNAFEVIASSGGGGTGTVTGAGLSCVTGAPDGCNVLVGNPGNATGYDTVTLTATADAGSVFKSWSSCNPVAGAPNTCTVYVNSVKYVYATFQPATYALNVSLSGNGAGTVSGGGVSCSPGSSDGCIVNEPNGGTVTLTATPSAGSVFTGWAGNCSGSGACSVTLTGAKYVQATFSAQ